MKPSISAFVTPDLRASRRLIDRARLKAASFKSRPHKRDNFMKARILSLIAGLMMVSVFPPHSAEAQQVPVSLQAKQIIATLDNMGVESKWIAGAHINWETGLPDNEPETYPGRHTHCSAFVASAAKKLGVYILRPPEHRQALLANAQNEWLATDGAAQGWAPVANPQEAQDDANRGMLVVASYHNHHDDKPGHIAIIRASSKSPKLIAQEGPDVIQAGTTNAKSISLRDGFAGHPAAWNNNEVRYYAHSVSTGPAGSY